MNTVTPTEWIIKCEIGNGSVLEIDVDKYWPLLDVEIEKHLDADCIAKSEDDHDLYTLTQCSKVCDADGPQLTFYVDEEIVVPFGEPVKFATKYYSYDALLTFWIVVQLKKDLRGKWAVDVLKGLQAKIEAGQ